MVFDGGDEVAGGLDLADVDRHATEGDAARILELVGQVHIAQVEAVHCSRHAGGVGVPVKQIERERILAHQVVIDHERPDQVVGTQHVEGTRHFGTFEEAALGHTLFEAGNCAFVEEDTEFARLGEVEHGGEEGSGVGALVLLGSHVGQRGHGQRTAQAVASEVDAVFTGVGANLVDRFQRTFEQVVFEGFLSQLLVRVDPGHDEGGMALAGCPVDHRVLLAQVKDVVLVDPRRDDQERLLVLVRGLGIVLDQLEQFVLEDHLALRGGNVLAHLEGRGVGHADAQLAVTGFNVVQQVVQTLDQVLAVRLDGFTEDFRVGQREVGGRQGVDVLTGEKIHLGLGGFVEAIGTGHGVMDVASGDQVGLLDEIEQEVLFPIFVLETVVTLFRGGDRGSVGHAHHLHHGTLPQREVVPHHVHLGLRKLVGVSHQAGGKIHKSFGYAQFISRSVNAFLGFLFHELGDNTRSTLGNFGIGLGHLGRIGQIDALVFGLLRHTQTPSVSGCTCLPASAYNESPRRCRCCATTDQLLPDSSDGQSLHPSRTLFGVYPIAG